MHELSLRTYRPINGSRHKQNLSILAGISAMQPVPILEKHLVFRPNKKQQEERAPARGGSQEVRVLKRHTAEKAEAPLHYVTMVGSVNGIKTKQQRQRTEEKTQDVIQDEKLHGNEEFKEPTKRTNDAKVGGEKDKMQWTLQFKDLPEPSQSVTSRAISETAIVSDDPLHYMEGKDHSFVTSFYIVGHRFTHQNTSIRLYRIYIDTAATNHDDLLTIVKDIGDHKRLLDPSGAFMLEASLRLEDTATTDSYNKLKDRGVKELHALKETLRGVVDLDSGDRLSMDPRVK